MLPWNLACLYPTPRFHRQLGFTPLWRRRLR